MNDTVAKPIQWHPAACIFPMLPDAELQELADDIEKQGQHEAIILLDGMVLDGRNRWAACKLRDIKPRTVELTEPPEDPVAYVMSLNLHRRHLTPSQASMCAARARELYEQQAKERQGKRTDIQDNCPESPKGQARDAAGKAFSVSGRSVDRASRVIEKGIPELAKAVDEGRMAVSTAAILATESPEVQKAEIENPKQSRTYKPGRGGGDETSAKEKKPRHAGEHIMSEVFAIGGADVAITQLKSIPEKNSFRDAAFDRVVRWIQSQRKVKK